MRKSFRDLFVWNASVDVAARVSVLAEQLVARKRFVLADQMQRASISIASNIAEGQGRLTKRDWRHFLGQARGSAYELETQLEIAARTQLLDRDDELRVTLARITCGLTRMIDHLA